MNKIERGIRSLITEGEVNKDTRDTLMRSRQNLIKKMVGLTIFQTSVFLLYITMGKVAGGTAPIFTGPSAAYSNPLPHVLILTAIVVGIATTAVGLALVVRIREAYGTIEEGEIHDQAETT